MWITILNLVTTDPQPASQGSTVGYWCDFRSELGGGRALFVPRSKDLARYPGQRLAARLDLEGAAVLQALPPENEGHSQAGQDASLLRPLPEPGDFAACGKVVSIIWLDDEMENGILEVLVGNQLFSLPLESGGFEFDYGERVTFLIHRLTLVESGEPAGYNNA